MAKEIVIYDDYGEVEYQKPRKKRQSDTSKSINKAKHKHEYLVCGFKDSESKDVNTRYYLGTYCRYCGKVNQVINSRTIELDNGMRTSVPITRKDIGNAPLYDYEFGMKYVPVMYCEDEYE